ncbi:MAG: aminopeptidase N, partial [Propionicimonas sp.]
AQPTAAAKAEAWRLATADPGIANETHFQITHNFWKFDQDEVLRPYVERYLEVAEAISAGRDGWGERGTTIRQHVLSLLFPSPLCDRATLDLLDRWRSGTELADAVERQYSEKRDDAERALFCQETAEQRR